MGRTISSVIIANLILFVMVTSSQAFQDLHHHWIFPILAGVFIVEWAASGGLSSWRSSSRWYDPAVARDTVLSLLAFLLVMGIVRHWSILHCIGRCSLKLGGACFMAGAAFWAQARLGSRFWGPVRSKTAALACLLWAIWLYAFGLGRAPQTTLDIVFLVLAGLLLAGWKKPVLRLCGLGILVSLAIRRVGSENPIVFLAVPAAIAFLRLAGREDAAP